MARRQLGVGRGELGRTTTGLLLFASDRVLGANDRYRAAVFSARRLVFGPAWLFVHRAEKVWRPRDRFLT